MNRGKRSFCIIFTILTIMLAGGSAMFTSSAETVSAATPYNVNKAPDGNWYYYENGSVKRIDTVAQNNNGWWGEGEIKFFMDGDSEYPTICGTGTEDYFCGSYDFEVDGIYRPYCTPYAGLSKITATDGAYKTQQRFNMYRWHINDPIYFDTDLRVTIQALGWRSGGRYLPLQDDISSVAYWYQDTPAPSGSVLGSRDDLEII